MKNYRCYFSLLLCLFISVATFAQKKSKYQINGELFELPGKWEFRNQIKESGQFHLVNKKDSSSLLISVRKPENFEFYRDGISDKELLNKFYQWESDYWSSSDGLQAEVSEILRDQREKYIIWKILIKNIESNNKDKISYLLYTVHHNKLIGITFSANSDRKISLTNEEAVAFLKKIDIK